ncbi:Rv1733c family protein [Streptomyces sp. NPDC004227]
MRANKPVRRPLWRWRSNPMRRREDVIEGWALLATWAVIAAGAPLAGVVVGQATADGLARQQVERHPATAVLVHSARPGGDSVTTPDDRVVGTVRWTAPDGTRHEDRTLVAPTLAAGDRIAVWTDPHHRVTPPPLTPSEAASQAAATGALVSLALAGAAGGGCCAVRAALDRRRARAWEAEWRKVGPQWGRAAR